MVPLGLFIGGRNATGTSDEQNLSLTAASTAWAFSGAIHQLSDTTIECYLLRIEENLQFVSSVISSS